MAEVAEKRDVITIEHQVPLAPVEQRHVVTPMEMLDRALSSGASPETLERLMGLQERWEANQAKKAFDAAMAGAKSEIPVISKSRKVDFTTAKGRTNYQYEDLGEIARTIDPILSRYGLSYRFRTRSAVNEPVEVTCIVSHELGYSEENTLSAGRDDSGNKNSIQQIGSTITYLQRYTLKAALGLAAARDDDGAKVDKAPEETKTITEAQASVIRDLIEQAKVDADKLCDHWKVEAIPDIPMASFNDVVSSLRRRIATLKERDNANATA